MDINKMEKITLVSIGMITNGQVKIEYPFLGEGEVDTDLVFKTIGALSSAKHNLLNVLETYHRGENDETIS